MSHTINVLLISVQQNHTAQSVSALMTLKLKYFILKTEQNRPRLCVKQTKTYINYDDELTHFSDESSNHNNQKCIFDFVIQS